MTRLPMLPADPNPLDRLTIDTPCEVPWESLAGDDRIRHCGRCRQNVYNVEAFDRAEALRLIQAREGRLCLRLHRRPDGTLVTADCWARLRAARCRGRLAFAAALVIVGWAQLWAIAVGLYGLRRLTVSRTMGSPVVTELAREVPPPPAPPIPAPATYPNPGVTMGKPRMVPPPPKAVRPPKEPTQLMGRIRRR